MLIPGAEAKVLRIRSKGTQLAHAVRGMHAAYSVSNLGMAGAAPATHTVPAGSAGRAGLPLVARPQPVWSESHLAHTRPICHDSATAVGGRSRCSPIFKRPNRCTPRCRTHGERPSRANRGRQACTPGGDAASRALLPWLPAIIAPRLRPHIVERLADIRDLWRRRRTKDLSALRPPTCPGRQ